MITTMNGFGYRPDDYSINTNDALEINGTGNILVAVDQTGVIEQHKRTSISFAS